MERREWWGDGGDSEEEEEKKEKGRRKIRERQGMVTSMTPNRVNIEQSASGNRKEEIFNLHTASGKVEAGWVSVTQ